MTGFLVTITIIVAVLLVIGIYLAIRGNRKIK
jgi:hypothetical protein